ncbi:hypothetical protein B296_00025144 [Ensete ventricosum]|uniref:Uncharacterized protein n=1 Tax=Ensete ventricosum TaxID=4639 RepID=A0A426Y8K7_ENSVE|nr:hypothetical protein B296_00025144 [Ensete ventricosum]
MVCLGLNSLPPRRAPLVGLDDIRPKGGPEVEKVGAVRTLRDGVVEIPNDTVGYRRPTDALRLLHACTQKVHGLLQVRKPKTAKLSEGESRRIAVVLFPATDRDRRRTTRPECRPDRGRATLLNHNGRKVAIVEGLTFMLASSNYMKAMLSRLARPLLSAFNHGTIIPSVMVELSVDMKNIVD